MSNDEKKQLGRILLTRKLVSPEALDSALKDKARVGSDTPLASFLTDSGMVREEDALRALSEQFGVPGINLSQVAILLEHLSVMPREMAEAHMMLPVLLRGDRLFIAMADPRNKRVIDELEFVSGKKVYAYVALSTPLHRTIAASYDAKDRGEQYYLGPEVPKETLARLGLSTQTPAPATFGGPKTTTSEQPTMQRPNTMGAALVVDDEMRKLAADSEFSTIDFGNVSADISQVADAEQLQGAPPMTSPTGGARPNAKTILIVDDEDDIRKMLRRIFVDKGHNVVEADRGLLALRMVKEHVPDLILLDAMLPELHGFDIARRIKGSEKYGKIPIIMMSAVYRGWRIAEDLKQAYGIEAYIEKPFKIAEITAAVAKSLAQRDSKKSQHPERDIEAVSADAEKLLEDGVNAYKAGNLDLAISYLAKGVQIDPLAYRLHFHLALLYGKKGSIYEGISELEKAIELNPRHFPALKNLAVLYEKAGFRHKAVEMWERCVHVAPDAETRSQVKEHLMTLL
ncbi:MAG: response regulator [Polyangiaceae bacterium]